MSAIIAIAFVFGGVMFGPDLDTVSRQYSRWFVFRFLWYPYRTFFKHRSRFSHGLIFGALVRVVYFLGVLTIAVYVRGVVVSHSVAREAYTDPCWILLRLGKVHRSICKSHISATFSAARLCRSMAGSGEPHIHGYGRDIHQNGPRYEKFF